MQSFVMLNIVNSSLERRIRGKKAVRPFFGDSATDGTTSRLCHKNEIFSDSSRNGTKLNKGRLTSGSSSSALSRAVFVGEARARLPKQILDRNRMG